MTFDVSLVHEIAPTGRLRASLNMANAVLALSHTSAATPAGVTIDLSRELARRLGVEVDFLQWDAPGDSLQALAGGQADIGFLAVDPKRAEQVYFTAPYVQIEGCYLVQDGSPLRHADAVDRPGTEIIVIDTSAYDLYLTRTLQHAHLTRLPDAEAVLHALLARGSGSLSVVAGVKQALLADIATTPGTHLLDGHFMAIMQAMVLPRARSDKARSAVESFLGDMVGSGFITAALDQHGIEGATVVGADIRG
ncbi:MAG: transporter substrate-binding domain-containing protein [Pseudomonadota bacterium]